ncbi:MAG: ferric reductase-like transmembrane domain-containing protein [Candidatus Moranbacteria bacterium]|nr:ferric reductase-like transmembrane domain-containing protein [Candidatus Moranbacteria bacterium]
MHKPSSLKDYAIAIFLAAILLTLFSSYLLIRRGYLFDAPPSADTFFVFNKVIIGVGTVLLALTFLIGPIVRYFDRFDKWLGYRKEIGIIGGFLALSHGILSYHFLPLKFPQEKFTIENIPFLAGLIGSLILVFLFVLSLERVIHLMDGKRWWFLQRFGLRAVIVFTVIHVVVMKWQGWMKWLKQGGTPSAELANPLLPGLGMLVSLFLAWVIIVRLYESIFLFKDCGFTTKEICTDENTKKRGRKFFIISFWVMILVYIFLFLRWA